MIKEREDAPPALVGLRLPLHAEYIGTPDRPCRSRQGRRLESDKRWSCEPPYYAFRDALLGACADPSWEKVA